MAFKFYMPDIGEGVVEGEIVAWKVKVGDKVTLDQLIVEVMTDKATVELPSPRAGTISAINYADGTICPVGKVLVEIEEFGAAAHVSTQLAAAVPSPAPVVVAAAAAPSGGGGLAMHGKVEVVDLTAGRSRVLATPATRRLARQMGVEIGRVVPTGKHGRVTTADVKAFTTGSTTALAVAAKSYAPVAIPHGGDEERIPFRGMRKKIAENMARSVHTAAHFTYVEEIDMTELVALRERVKAKAAARGVKLNYLPFIVKAIVSSLRQWPALNSSLDEATQEIVRKRYYHIGIAAQGPQGLAVSVLRDADKRSIFDLAREIERLGEAVRTGSATRDELTGSTFTISSLGKLGGVLATPIVNFPEVGIVGVHEMKQKPAVVDGQIVARWLMNLSISLDHRLVDGWDGAMFLQDVKTLLEDPTTMFLEMV